jgi:hypothetical protein
MTTNDDSLTVQDKDGTATLAALADQQNRLLAQIHEPNLSGGPRGLAAYRVNAQACALRALEAAYPVMSQLIGEENFAFLARDFWQTHPPALGDLAQWGEPLAAYVAQAPQLADLPFLPDVARIEWALHVCAGAADRTQDAASFAGLADGDPNALWFSLAPGACALVSAYPAAAITLAHKGQGSLDAAFDLLKQGVAQTALVWRQGYAPRLRVLHAHEVAFTQALLAGQALANALDVAHASFDFSHWLAANVQSGLVLRVGAKPPPT